MSLKDRLRFELQRLAGSGGSPPPLTLAERDGLLRIDLTEVGAVGCAFARLTYTTPELDNAPLDALRRLAQQLEQRLSYLLEPIRPIEVDEDACVVQLRSNPPDQDESQTRYYELVVQRGEIRMGRYQKRKGQPREAIPAEVTHEVLLRLARDLTSL